MAAPVIIALAAVVIAVACRAVAVVLRDRETREAADDRATDDADRAAMRHRIADQSARTCADDCAGRLASLAPCVCGRRARADNEHRNHQYLRDAHETSPRILNL